MFVLSFSLYDNIFKVVQTFLNMLAQFFYAFQVKILTKLVKLAKN